MRISDWSSDVCSSDLKFGRDYSLNMGALTGSIRGQGVSIASLAQPHNNGFNEISSNADPALNFAATYNGRQQSNPAAQFGFRISPKLAVAEIGRAHV